MDIVCITTGKIKEGEYIEGKQHLFIERKLNEDEQYSHGVTSTGKSLCGKIKSLSDDPDSINFSDWEHDLKDHDEIRINCCKTCIKLEPKYTVL